MKHPAVLCMLNSENHSRKFSSACGIEPQICAAAGHGSFVSARSLVDLWLTSLTPTGPFYLLHPCTPPQPQAESPVLQIVLGPKEAAGQSWPA